MRNRLAAGLALSLILLSGPAAARGSQQVAMAFEEQQIIDWAANWKKHFEAGDTEKLRPMYEPDAVLMAHGAPAQRGIEEILAFLGRNKAAGNRVTIDFANEDITIDGNRAYLTAKYWMTIARPSGAPINVHGRSFLVFKRGSDGEWRLWRDMDNQAPDVRAEDRPGS